MIYAFEENFKFFYICVYSLADNRIVSASFYFTRKYSHLSIIMSYFSEFLTFKNLNVTAILCYLWCFLSLLSL